MTRTEDHNNHSNNKQPQPPFSSQQQKRAAVSEEAAIFNTFALIVRNKFVLTPSSSSSPSSSESQPQGQSSKDRQDDAAQQQERINRLDDLYSNPEYNAEKKMLQKMNNNGMVYGLACGLLTFGLLRSGPRLMQRYLNRKLMHSKRSNSGGSSSSSTYGNNTTVGGYTFDQPTSSGGSLGPSTTRGGFFKSTTRGGIFLRTLKFGLDLTVSLFMAAYGSLVFVDRKKLMDDMSKIPLVEGRSLVSDELCDEFVDVYRRIPKHTWEKYEGKSDALDAIGGFVKNCMKREIVEKNILEKRRGFGMDILQQQQEENVKDEKEHGTLMRHGSKKSKRPKRRHVTIPSPGVSPDIPVRIEWIESQGGEDVIVARERSYVLGGGVTDENGKDDYLGIYNDNDDDFGNFDDFTSQEDENDGSEKRQ